MPSRFARSALFATLLLAAVGASAVTLNTGDNHAFISTETPTTTRWAMWGITTTTTASRWTST